MNLYDLPEILEAFTNLIRALAWPLLIGVVVFYFRKEIRELLKKLQELKAIGGPGLWNFLFDSSGDSQPPQAPAMLTSSSGTGQVAAPFDKTKYGNIFWVGHDLLWTVAQLLSRGPREKILEGLFQSKHHLSEIRFTEPAFIRRLERIYQEAERTQESDWTVERRGKAATEIQSLAREIGGLVAANQTGFKSHPS